MLSGPIENAVAQIVGKSNAGPNRRKCEHSNWVTNQWVEINLFNENLLSWPTQSVTTHNGSSCYTQILKVDRLAIGDTGGFIVESM